MPTAFAVARALSGDPGVATFAAFGSFALVLLVEFTGPMVDRLRSQVALIAVGAALVAAGTLASRSPWLATAAMAVVGFCVLFAGVVSSVLASASVALLLAFILPVSVEAPTSAIPYRLAGWGLAGAASLVAIVFLWPSPPGDRLRAQAVIACRAIAALLRAEAGDLLAGTAETRAERAAASAEAEAATTALRRLFLATPYRPAGLSQAGQAVVRLVDEIPWLHAILADAPHHPHGLPLNESACAVKTGSASVLEQGADVLEQPMRNPDALHEAIGDLHTTLGRMKVDRAPGRGPKVPTAELVSALDPGFRAQELAFAVSRIGHDAETVALADRRPWLQRLLGRAPRGLPDAAAAARRQVAANLEPHSVWLHNSLRGGAGLAIAVLVSTLTGVQHSFWVILGTLSVLRSNALTTGQNVFRGLVGTAVGVLIGAGVLAFVGTNTVVLWVLLPPAVLCAGFAPAAFSFAAGQAAFTLTIVILFNIIQPTGWHVGLIRIEDVALGFAISLVVGVLFWPRGAVTVLRRELSEAYSESARYLGAAVEYGLARSGAHRSAALEPEFEAERAAAAAGRLDDAFRTYLAERAAKPLPLADVTGLVNGVVALRLAGDAVVELWRHDRGEATFDDADARTELRALSLGVVGWYEVLAAALDIGGRVPDPLGPDTNRIERLVGSLGSNGDNGRMMLTARIVWTCDHLDAARRLQAVLVTPTIAVTGHSALRRMGRAPVPAPAAASDG
jgi:uncharacterized membrane protein YccC